MVGVVGSNPIEPTNELLDVIKCGFGKISEAVFFLAIFLKLKQVLRVRLKIC